MRLLSALRWRVLVGSLLGLGSSSSPARSTGTTNLLWHCSNSLPFRNQRLRLERSEALKSWFHGEEIEITAPDGSMQLYDDTLNASCTQLFRAVERR